MNNKISIIIPAYNIEAYLPATLDSVLAQTYTDIEIIVVNDGSTDGTAQVLSEYASRDSRIKAIHKENGGVTSARLRGVTEASGGWIGFVDGDDYIEPDFYERLLQNALQWNADISHCGFRMVFPGGRVDYYYNTGKSVCQEGIQGCRDLLAAAFVEPALVNKLYRRPLFAGLEQWMDQSIRINEDLLMNYYLFKHAQKSIYEDVCPYHYVLRKGSAATSKINVHKLQDPVKVSHIILEDAEETLIPLVIPRLTRQLIAGATMVPGGVGDIVLPHRRASRRELRQRLPRILFGDECGIKLKLMALWASVWPASYGWAHRMYARVAGTDKKYSIE